MKVIDRESLSAREAGVLLAALTSRGNHSTRLRDLPSQHRNVLTGMTAKAMKDRRVRCMAIGDPQCKPAYRKRLPSVPRAVLQR